MAMVEGHLAIEPPDNVVEWDVDPYDEAILRDPYAFYAELRDKGPFVYLTKYSMLAVGRFQETRKVFSDWKQFVSSRGVGLDDFAHQEPYRTPSIILEVDPPDHAKTRKVMAQALSRPAIIEFQTLFAGTAERLIDGLLERDSFEAVTDLAEAFPTTVFPAAVGMKESDARRLVDYGAMVFNAVGPNNQLRQKSMAKAPDLVPWITAACAREQLSEDGLGAKIYAHADAGNITLEEAGMLVRSFLSAGVDTTVTGIGNALWCLAQNPEQFDVLKADPSLIKPCFEEVLRYTSPVHAFCRTSAVNTHIAGVDIQEGSKVLCVLAAANRDAEKWGDPDVFRVDRKPAGHLAFGVGIHGCVGQILARAELEAVLQVLVAKVSRIEMLGDPVWRPNNAIHALDSMQLRLHKSR